jgi:glycosyltransferase involved in cell wall biosynthesis
MADGIVAVSDGVADDLARHTGLPRETITTVYNPVITAELAPLAAEPIDHPWFQAPAPPLILGVGSLAARKDFPTLLRAFARVRGQRACRLCYRFIHNQLTIIACRHQYNFQPIDHYYTEQQVKA